METQALLYSRSGEIPEGLYIDLMNTLKIDFDNDKAKKYTNIIIVKEDIELIKKYIHFFKICEIIIKVFLSIYIFSMIYLLFFIILQ